MPIRLDMRNPDIDVEPGTAKSEIVVFLYTNLAYGYKPEEIAAELDLTDETTTGILNDLCEVDYAGQTENGYYHGLRSQTPLRRYTSSVAQTKRMFDQPAEVDTQPEFNAESVNEAKLDAEVERLEQELEDELKR